MDALQKALNQLDDNNAEKNITYFNTLIKSCVESNEMGAVVYIYDTMRVLNITPTKYTYELIDLLHSKTVVENSKLRIKTPTYHKLKPRRRIHKIMKGYHYSENYNKAQIHLDHVKQYLKENPDVMRFGRIKLAKNISRCCSITFNDARYIITKLKRTKFLSSDRNNKSVGTQGLNLPNQTKITQFFKQSGAI